METTEINFKEEIISPSKLDAFFSSLEPIEPDEIIGTWLGGCFLTGKLFERILVRRKYIYWYGKKFKSENKVKALVISFLGIKFNIPFGTARLRRLMFRNKMSTAMVYNYLPIIDYFRRINENKIMGIMEWKGKVGIYFYLVRRKKKLNTIHIFKKRRQHI